MNVVGSQRPLAPLYRPDERFDISAAGLQEWYRSDCFRRVAEFYTAYPQRSLFADNGRALLHHMIVMLRPETEVSSTRKTFEASPFSERPSSKTSVTLARSSSST